MKLWENRKLAWAVLALAVALTVLFSCAAGLRRERSHALDTFYEGTQGDGLSAYNDLQKRAECAYNLLTLATKYNRNDTEGARALTAARRALLDAQTIAEMAEANRALTEAASLIYSENDSYGMTEQDDRLFERQITEIISRGETISHNDYDPQAERFNKRLSGFPRGVVSALMGIEPLDRIK